MIQGYAFNGQSAKTDISLVTALGASWHRFDNQNITPTVLAPMMEAFQASGIRAVVTTHGNVNETIDYARRGFLVEGWNEPDREDMDSQTVQMVVTRIGYYASRGVRVIGPSASTLENPWSESFLADHPKEASHLLMWSDHGYGAELSQMEAIIRRRRDTVRALGIPYVITEAGPQPALTDEDARAEWYFEMIQICQRLGVPLCLFQWPNDPKGHGLVDGLSWYWNVPTRAYDLLHAKLKARASSTPPITPPTLG